MNQLYSKEVMKHFRNPHNIGHIKDPSGHGKVGNLLCGDVMHLYIKVDKRRNKEVISSVKFETFGCAAAISTSSVITGLAKGKSIEQALKISNKDVTKELGGLPPIKIHCSLLATDALKEAIYDYLKRNKKPVPKELEEHHKKLLEDMQRIEEKYGDLDEM